MTDQELHLGGPTRDGYLSNVVTYGADGESINLSERQIDTLTRAGKWPRSSRGTELVNVERGKHQGYTTYSDATLYAELGIDMLPKLIFTLSAASGTVNGWLRREDAEIAVREGDWWIAPSRFLTEVESDYREGLGLLTTPDLALRFQSDYPRWMSSGGGARMDDRTRTVYPNDACESWARLDAQRELDRRCGPQPLHRGWRGRLYGE